MKIQEFYQAVGGSYEEVLSRLMKDERILKYLARVPQDPNYGELMARLDEKNYPEAFRNVHTLKGLALNLGLGNLAEASSTLCEDIRNGPPTGDIQAERCAVQENYQEVLRQLHELLNT